MEETHQADPYYEARGEQSEIHQDDGFPVVYRSFAACEGGDTVTGGGCTAVDDNNVLGVFQLIGFAANNETSTQSFGCQYLNPDKRAITVIATAICFDADGSRQKDVEDDAE